MRLSNILPSLLTKNDYKIENEKEFDTLALTASELSLSACTFFDNMKFIGDVKNNITMILTNEELYEAVNSRYGADKGICIVKQPRAVYFEIHNLLADSKDYIREQFATQIGEGCCISPLASIATNNVVIGNNATIEEFVVIRENTEIGDNCIIRSGTVLGAQGFEFKRMGSEMLSVEHLGGVKISNNVEIQYNCCINRAVYPWDDTLIGAYSKIDDLVHLGHGVKVGANVLIVAKSAIGGRTVVEDDSWIGFGTTVCNGIHVGKAARVNMGAVVSRSIGDNASVTGNFAIDHKRFIEHIKNISNG